MSTLYDLTISLHGVVAVDPLTAASTLKAASFKLCCVHLDANVYLMCALAVKGLVVSSV